MTDEVAVKVVQIVNALPDWISTAFGALVFGALVLAPLFRLWVHVRWRPLNREPRHQSHARVVRRQPLVIVQRFKR